MRILLLPIRLHDIVDGFLRSRIDDGVELLYEAAVWFDVEQYKLLDRIERIFSGE